MQDSMMELQRRESHFSDGNFAYMEEMYEIYLSYADFRLDIVFFETSHTFDNLGRLFLFIDQNF